MSKSLPQMRRRRPSNSGSILKFLKWVGRREKETEITRMAKLERVAQFIRSGKRVGTVDNPSTYFASELEMSWGSFFGQMVLFVGKLSPVGVVLGGSVHHIIGESPRGMAPVSALPSIFQALSKHSEVDAQGQEHRDEMDLRRAWSVAERFSAPPQRVEFLARKYVCGEVDGRIVLIGSPLYVALAD